MTREQTIALIARKLEPETWAALQLRDFTDAVTAAAAPVRLGLMVAISRQDEQAIGAQVLRIMRPFVAARALANATALLDQNDKISIDDIGRVFSR